mmetsp:Transcript_13213/g.17287  ORF Transcript_13213/g.17287 Transcript_13213/m.17287 type:complete len:187 (+) Transcript_13213:96-656(+)
MKLLLVIALCLPALTPALIRPALPSDSLAHRTAREAGVKIDVVSERKGLGAFATKKMKVGSYIGEYRGEILSKTEVQARIWGRRKTNTKDKEWIRDRKERGQSITGDYVFEMKTGHFIDCEDADHSSWCRFMNHASEENRNANVKGFDKVSKDDDVLDFPQFYAIKDIQEGDELVYDYGSRFFKDP